MRRSTCAPDERKDAERPSVSPFSLPSGRLRFEFRCDPPRSDGRSCSTAWGYPADVGLETFAMTKRTNKSSTAGTLLHLVSFGLVAVVTVISFGFASFSFLYNSREMLVSSRIGEAAIEFAYPHAAVVPYTEGHAVPAAAVADSPSSVSANLPLPSAAQNLTSSYIQPEGPGSSSNFEPPSEQEASPTIQEARHTSPTQRAPIDKPLIEAQQRASVSMPLAQVATLPRLIACRSAAVILILTSPSTFSSSEKYG
jgi:hypothetical protein